MHSPPDPGRIGVLVAVAKKLGLLATTGGTGFLDGATIILTKDGDHAVSWAIVDGQTPPSGFAAYAITVEAWTALKFGDLTQDGLVAHGGHRYSVSAIWDGSRNVAALTEIGTSA
jgi:hypothetical protein